MIKVELPKVSLDKARLNRIAFFQKSGDPFAKVDNILCEDGTNMLLENGGCILI